MTDWIDITRVLHDGMTGWPGDPPFRLETLADGAADDVRLTGIHASVHIGTHIDAPLHCFAGGGDIAGISLDRLCGPAVVVDVGGRHEVAVEDLQTTVICSGDRVLLRSESPFPAITAQAAHWILDRGVVLVGLAWPSPDRPDAVALPIHRILLGGGVPIIENLDLDRVKPGRYELVALPLPISGAEAAPARVILRRHETQQQQA
jgi:arylformamidase